MKDKNLKLLNFASSQLLLFLFVMPLFAMNNNDIAHYQKELSGEPVGDRIALWAEKFIGTPYDPDPLGEYVTKKVIVADEHVDCMYLSFRAVELALSHTTEEAIAVALDKRFRDKGLTKNGQVINYEDRFQYGEDMLDSGKWGREITGALGDLTFIKGSRGKEKIGMLSAGALRKALDRKTKSISSQLRSGDFVFFIRPPGKRVAEEIVGHIGIIKKEGSAAYLIHASGKKNLGGSVKKVLLKDYTKTMPFAGVRVSRLE